MGELFSDRHPTVPGWYWLSNGVERIVAQLFPSRRAENLLACHVDLGDAVNLTTVLELGWKFGPLIPAPEKIAQFLQQPSSPIPTEAERQVRSVYPQAVCIRDSYLLRILIHPDGQIIS